MPSCGDCRKWLYGSDWRVARRPNPDGPPVPRPAFSRPPCGTCPKIPRPLPPGETARTAWWGMAVELTDQNWQAYRHYRECRAVNWQVADAADPLVRRHAAVIRAVEDEVEQSRQVRTLEGLFRPLGGGRK